MPLASASSHCSQHRLQRHLTLCHIRQSASGNLQHQEPQRLACFLFPALWGRRANPREHYRRLRPQCWSHRDCRTVRHLGSRRLCPASPARRPLPLSSRACSARLATCGSQLQASCRRRAGSRAYSSAMVWVRQPRRCRFSGNRQAAQPSHARFSHPMAARRLRL